LASGDVNFQSIDISGGTITLTGSPTGSGVYAVGCEADANGDEITAIAGGTGYAMITLYPATVGEYFVLYDNGTSILLKEQLGFEPQSVHDFIDLRGNSNGTVWREHNRGRFPV